MVFILGGWGRNYQNYYQLNHTKGLQFFAMKDPLIVEILNFLKNYSSFQES